MNADLPSSYELSSSVLSEPRFNLTQGTLFHPSDGSQPLRVLLAQGPLIPPEASAHAIVYYGNIGDTEVAFRQSKIGHDKPDRNHELYQVLAGRHPDFIPPIIAEGTMPFWFLEGTDSPTQHKVLATQYIALPISDYNDLPLHRAVSLCDAEYRQGKRLWPDGVYYADYQPDVLWDDPKRIS